MSSHMWVSGDRAVELGRVAHILAEESELLAAQLPGELREMILGASGALALASERLGAGQGPVRMDAPRPGEQLREVGASTLRKIRQFRPNRGPR